MMIISLQFILVHKLDINGVDHTVVLNIQLKVNYVCEIRMTYIEKLKVASVASHWTGRSFLLTNCSRSQFDSTSHIFIESPPARLSDIIMENTKGNSFVHRYGTTTV